MQFFLHSSAMLLLTFFWATNSIASSHTITHKYSKGKVGNKQQNHQATNLNHTKTIITEHNGLTKITCFGRNGKPRFYIIKGNIDGSVIVKCTTDAEKNPHLYIKKDGDVLEIGVTKIRGEGKNLFVINDNTFGNNAEITFEGSDSKLSYGNVDINGIDNSNVINTTTINGQIHVKGGGSNVNIGSVTIGN